MVDPIGTCQALDLLTQDQLEQLFDESNGYLSKVDEIFDTVQIAEMQQEEEENENENNHSSSSDSNSNNINEKKKKIHRHRHRRMSSTIITDKKCLILDVDNTLIYVRHFMDEMRVGDLVKLGDKDATVIKITYRLDLEFSENPGTMSSYDHVLQSKDDSIPQRGEWFPDELSKVAIIHQADPTGCVIKLSDTENEENENENEIDISFLQNSDELSQLEPMMSRENYISVTFMYGGYLVRIRPGLEKFLSLCNAKYDVILFTAADGSVYEGLLKQVHHILKQTLTDLQESESESDANNIDFIIPHKLWQNVYFRSDCDEKLDEYGLPYRHKNLAKLGRELSTIVMVDDNPLSYRGFEPNSVRVAGFWGLAQPIDNELMETLFPTLWTIADHKDVRYHLSGLGPPPPDTKNIPTSTGVMGGIIAKNHNDDDLLTRQRRHSRQASAKFLQHLKDAIVAENESLEESTDGDEDSSVVIEQTPNDSDSDGEEEDSLDSLSKSNEKQQSQSDSSAIVKKYTSMTNDELVSSQKNEEKHNKNKLTHSELDEIFNDDDNKNNNNNNNNNNAHNRMNTHESESGIGSGGALIFDNYDEDVLFRDAYESPKARATPIPPNIFETKRPSIELDKPQDEARRTVPNSPNDDDNDDNDNDNDELEDLSSPCKDIPPLDSYNNGDGDDEQEEVDNNGDFVSPGKNISPTDSVSSNKRVDTKLLHGSTGNSSSSSNSSNSSAITGFIDIEMMHRQRKTGSRPEREIFDETDAEILIEKTSGCSCFGWFGKKKSKSKNIGLGLAQQELR